MSRPKVAVLMTTPESVTEDYSRLLNLVSFGEVLPPGQDVFLAVDLTWHHFFPSCSTPPWQLDGIIHELLNIGYSADSIHACYNKTTGVTVKKGEILNRQRIVLEKHGAHICHTGEDARWTVHHPGKPLRVLGNIYPGGIPVPDRYINSPVIYLPTMKTHHTAIIAGALYSAFESILNEKRIRAHAQIHDALADTLVLLKELHPGMLAVMDGAFAGDGCGPRRLRPHITNVIAASQDPLALDAVTASMMGFDPLAIPFIRIAHEAGLGTGDIQEIELLGDDISGMNFQFRVDPTPVDTLLGKLERTAPGSHLSMLYHDWYWYIAAGEPRIKQVMKSQWWKLFESYRK